MRFAALEGSRSSDMKPMARQAQASTATRPDLSDGLRFGEIVPDGATLA
jgi:hypothetical protein